MRWLYDQHGVRSEPCGAIGLAVLLNRVVDLDGESDVVVVVSGRNANEEAFRRWIGAI